MTKRCRGREGLDGLRVVRVPLTLGRKAVRRRACYAQLYALLAAAERGLEALGREAAEDPELYGEAVRAVRGLREDLLNAAGGGADCGGRPPRP